MMEAQQNRPGSPAPDYGPGNTTSTIGNDDWLYKFTVSALEAYLSIRNATTSGAWSLRSFQDHVFTASAVMEAAGFLMGLVLYFKGGRNDSYLGHPLMTFASSLATPMVRLFKEWQWPDDCNPLEDDDNLFAAMWLLSLSNVVFLFMYVSTTSSATIFYCVLGGLALTACCCSSLVYTAREDISERSRAYAAGSIMLSTVAFTIALPQFICFPPFLELLEGALLLKSEISAGSLSDSTIVLVILDAVMVAPIVLPLMVSVGTCFGFCAFQAVTCRVCQDDDVCVRSTPAAEGGSGSSRV